MRRESYLKIRNIITKEINNILFTIVSYQSILKLSNNTSLGEFDNLGINIELHSRTIKSFHSFAMNYS